MNAACEVSLGFPHLSSHSNGFSAELFQPEQFGVYSQQQQFAGKLSQTKAHRTARTNPISGSRTPKASYAPVEGPCITSSRVKSTSPDLPLLFSLFDVLQEEHPAADYPSEYGSSPSSTSSPLPSEYSENASSPHYDALSHEATYPAYAESLSTQWLSTSAHGQIYYDTTHPLLANFVDFD